MKVGDLVKLAWEEQTTLGIIVEIGEHAEDGWARVSWDFLAGGISLCIIKELEIIS